MELLLAVGIGVLTSAGVYLILRPRTFQVIIGFALLTYAVNLFIVTMGRVRGTVPPIVGDDVPLAALADPVPQALVLTSIVISFSMTALFLVLLITSRGLTGTDHVDGEEPQLPAPTPGPGVGSSPSEIVGSSPT